MQRGIYVPEVCAQEVRNNYDICVRICSSAFFFESWRARFYVFVSLFSEYFPFKTGFFPSNDKDSQVRHDA